MGNKNQGWKCRMRQGASVMVVALFSGACGGGSGTAQFPIDPSPSDGLAAPKALAAATFGGTSIWLTWDEPAATLGLNIERSKGSDANFVPLLDRSSDAGAFLDEDLDPETQYFYRAQYHQGSLRSAWAGPVSATTPAVATVPAAPSDLAVTAQSTGSILVTWMDQADNEQAYRVERSNDGVNYDVLIEVLPPDTESYMNEGLTAESEYWYRVFATNDAGDSQAAGPKSATTEPVLTLTYDVSVPASSTTGSYSVALTASGGLTPPASAFIEEATDASFTQGYKKYTNSSFNSPWIQPISNNATGSYYYRGGNGSNVSNYKSVTVSKPATPTTIKLYPKYDNQIVKDDFTVGSNGNTVFATGNFGVGWNYTVSKTKNTAVYGTKILFDLSGLKGTVSSAKLRLYASTLAQEQTANYLYQIAANRYSWSPSSVTGNTKNAWEYLGTGLKTKSPPTSTSLVAWDVDVTTIVKNWFGGTSNYGFLLTGTVPKTLPKATTYRTTYFHSSEASRLNAARRPQLVITYTPTN